MKNFENKEIHLQSTLNCIMKSRNSVTFTIYFTFHYLILYPINPEGRVNSALVKVAVGLSKMF